MATGIVVLTGHAERPCHHRRVTVWLFGWIALLVWIATAWSSSCHAQDDYYPLPQRNASRFGFPYPAPAPDEPGVTFNRRYMLDGHPELEFNPRSEDEVWLVTTREIDGTSGTAPTDLDQFVCKHPLGTAWNQVPMQQLMQTQRAHPHIHTVIFIHGNRTSAFWSRRRGKHAYQALIGNNPRPLPPVRFVIWSWPSDPDKGLFRDFGKKLRRADVDGHLMGQFLSQLGSGPVSILGYSLGAQIALTAIDRSDIRSENRSNVNLLAMVPVTQCNWPESVCELQGTRDRISQIRLFRNSDDLAIRAFAAYCQLSGAGTRPTGIDALAREHSNVIQYDVSETIGSEHNVIAYVSQPQVRAELESLLTR